VGKAVRSIDFADEDFRLDKLLRLDTVSTTSQRTLLFAVSPEAFMSFIRGLWQSWFRLISFAALPTVIFCSSVSGQVSTTGKIGGVVLTLRGSGSDRLHHGEESCAHGRSHAAAQADGSYLFDLLPPGITS